ncbi:unnamed protein product [Prorocentrum cordatum]|uniref:Calcineurin-like phosphoesterase domain-containing protein n=1 Tax=Prorocentrum cordatum TaxID=2364126 RepID=A0ABN9S635_9DINO|nr:unnamed protein product [Polarella glacialis]
MSGGLEEVTDFAAWLRDLRAALRAQDRHRRQPRPGDGQDVRWAPRQHGQGRGLRQGPCRLRRRLWRRGARREIPGRRGSECSVCGVRIYGSPWQPEFGFWAFNLPRGEAILEKWRAVPAGVDVLMVHGPALGRGDGCLPSWKRVGCADLLREVQDRIRPAFLVCGHVHESAGVTFDGTTHFVNACSVDEDYDCVHPPLVFDIPARSGG